MADTQVKTQVAIPAAPPPAPTTAAATPAMEIVQVILDHDPQGTEAQLRALGMDVMKYGSCASSRRTSGVPVDERRLGCPVWASCTLDHIKGKSGPVNLPFRLFKKGGKVREGWGPCFGVFRLSAQYNHDENYVMEILPLSTAVGMPGSKMNKRPDGSEFWEDEVVEQKVPPFPKFGTRGYRVGEMHAAEVRRKVLEERRAADRRQAFIDDTMKIGPGDGDPAKPEQV